MAVGSLDVIYITMESVIGTAAVVGNALVIWAVKLNPALQKTTFFYIVSLALSDIAMGILVMPLAVIVSLGVVTHFYSCLFMCCLMMIFSHASILSLLAIAVDRYLRVKLPTRYRAAVTKKRICVTLALCWLVSVLVGLVPMLGWNRHTGSSSHIECHYLAVMRMDYVVYFSFLAWILLPLLVMCALYAKIFYIIILAAFGHPELRFLLLPLLQHPAGSDVPEHPAVPLQLSHEPHRLCLQNPEVQGNVRFHSEELHPAPEGRVRSF
ncbi:adenosine receptor A3-like isoform X2 [Lathamus discolor]|uniref:adenosine receptor A3-like isoform X2 n=1 Tax=Lathamus discolor TaxID=678569 RepID=UPI0032B81FF7